MFDDPVVRNSRKVSAKFYAHALSVAEIARISSLFYFMHLINEWRCERTLQLDFSRTNNERQHFTSDWHGMGLFDMGFSWTVSHGGRGMRASHHNFVVISLIIMKFGTGIKLDEFYTMVTKTFVTSLLCRNYDIIALFLLPKNDDVTHREWTSSPRMHIVYPRW